MQFSASKYIKAVQIVPKSYLYVADYTYKIMH